MFEPSPQRHLAERMSGLFGVAKERRGSLRLSLRRAVPYALGGLVLVAGLAAGYIALRRWRAVGRLPWGDSEADRQGAQQRRDVEQKRFDVGMSTSFLVIQAQRDLAQARQNELAAVLAYDLSLVDFEALQQAGPAGQ